MSEEKLVQVRNLMNNKVGYKIPEDNIRREWAPGEIKELPESEVRKGSYQMGIRRLFQENLCIEDAALAEELVGITEDTIEYKWTVDDVDKLLSTGSMDDLLDALDFAPEGIIDLIVDRAVKTSLNDMNKRKAISEATGRDLNSMIQFYEEDLEEQGSDKKDAPRTRRSVKAETKTAPEDAAAPKKLRRSASE